ncbi:MAG: oxygen-independent coproporphyrinogen III oxidase [Lachnospiraceae bacterium]|nr:oxygen-independent coproporphyrinogen III oxidase [Lachnospiraceae bacterium]
MKKDLGIYIHIPFCVRKCLYCDFLSFACGREEQERYMDALYKEIRAFSGRLNGREVSTVFIGGGTPSVVDTALLGKVFEALYENYNIKADAEITMELNPGTVTAESLKEYKTMGINRLSMGLQAWQDRLLNTLGRIHTAEKFKESFLLAREAGFENINVDIMLSLPGQTVEDVKETFENVMALDPEHVSAYSLIIEDGTPFKDMFESGKFDEIDDDFDREIYHLSCDILDRNGYKRYEISNFSKKGYESRHNSIYWRTDEYIGFGLGAHSYFKGERYHNTEDMERYIALSEDYESIKEDAEKLTKEDRISEFMFMGLRMDEGIKRSAFRERFGMDMNDVYRDMIIKYMDMGMIEETDGGIRITDKGIDVSNVIFSEFLL